MKVLLVGATGNVGSRLVPALIKHQHSVVLYVRNPSRLSKAATSQAASVVTGLAVDSNAVKRAILDNGCDALINTAGLASMFSRSKTPDSLPKIFEALVKASGEARKERGGAPLRCWFMGGWTLLDRPDSKNLIYDSVPMFPDHVGNFNHIKERDPKADEIAWSFFCASALSSKFEEAQYPAPPEYDSDKNLIAQADSPPAWSPKARGIPLIGSSLNVMAQASEYYTALEDAADFMARDLTSGLDSPWIGKKVGVKNK